tara:strand:- start:605 stop:1564 length:960 start_codon:yes stop_codon:yes gene_type:complete
MSNIFEKLNIVIKIFLNKYILKKPDFSEKKIFLQAQYLYELNKKKQKIQNLSEVEFSAFSQFGEDGIITWLIEKIPNISKVFLEIGTQDYWESNTRFLLKLKNWKGYLIEGSKKDVNKIKSQRIYWQNNLKVINQFINKENINEIILQNIKESKIGLLSIDIDGNDYWILENLQNLNADLVVCEYNPIFGDLHCITTIYDPNFVRHNKHFSNLYFGCSIMALIKLMKKKKYTFLGSNSKGMNAFFVKDENIKYLDDKIIHKKIFAPILREGRDKNTKLNYRTVFENLNEIKNMEIFDLEENTNKKLSSYKNLFSKEWKN